MTIAACIAAAKFLLPFLFGYLTRHGVQKLAAAQAETESAETKARDPSQGNDTTDLDSL